MIVVVGLFMAMAVIVAVAVGGASEVVAGSQQTITHQNNGTFKNCRTFNAAFHCQPSCVAVVVVAAATAAVCILIYLKNSLKKIFESSTN